MIYTVPQPAFQRCKNLQLICLPSCIRTTMSTMQRMSQMQSRALKMRIDFFLLKKKHLLRNHGITITIYPLENTIQYVISTSPSPSSISSQSQYGHHHETCSRALSMQQTTNERESVTIFTIKNTFDIIIMTIIQPSKHWASGFELPDHGSATNQ